MKKIIQVRAVMEFEFDADGYDENHVDISGLAKDSFKREIQSLIDTGKLTANDFTYWAVIPPQIPVVDSFNNMGGDILYEKNYY